MDHKYISISNPTANGTSPSLKSGSQSEILRSSSNPLCQCPRFGISVQSDSVMDAYDGCVCVCLSVRVCALSTLQGSHAPTLNGKIQQTIDNSRITSYLNMCVFDMSTVKCLILVSNWFLQCMFVWPLRYGFQSKCIQVRTNTVFDGVCIDLFGSHQYMPDFALFTKLLGTLLWLHSKRTAFIVDIQKKINKIKIDIPLPSLIIPIRNTRASYQVRFDFALEVWSAD